VKSLYWFNDAVRDTLRSWPEPVRKDLGHQMRDVQSGAFPPAAKWLTGVSPQAMQLKSKGYRAIVAVSIGDSIWVVHAFEKDSLRGKTTRKHHIQIVRQRLAELERQHSGNRSH
jgi:phage-related protein